MENWPTLMGVAALAVLCDRMLGWMERRGWIYWRHRAEELRALPSGATAPPSPAEWLAERDPHRMLRPPRRPLRRLGGRMRPRG
jgi:hypothetical protein